jgi:hypothetical protein
MAQDVVGERHIGCLGYLKIALSIRNAENFMLVVS